MASFPPTLPLSLCVDPCLSYVLMFVLILCCVMFLSCLTPGDVLGEGVVAGFCHFGLVYLWFCDGPLTLPSCLVLWLTCMALLFRLRALFHVMAWCYRILALLSCSGSVLVFVSEFEHSRSRFALAVGACGLEFARAERSSVRVHCVLSGTWFGCIFFPLSRFVARSSFFAPFWHLSLVLTCLCGTQLVFFTGCVLSCLS